MIDTKGAHQMQAELKRFPISADLKQYGKPLDQPRKEPLPVFVSGNIFEVDDAFYTPAADGNGHFTLIVHNRSKAWVDVNIDRSGGVSATGHIDDGSDGGYTEATQLYVQ